MYLSPLSASLRRFRDFKNYGRLPVILVPIPELDRVFVKPGRDKLDNDVPDPTIFPEPAMDTREWCQIRAIVGQPATLLETLRVTRFSPIRLCVEVEQNLITCAPGINHSTVLLDPVFVFHRLEWCELKAHAIRSERQLLSRYRTRTGAGESCQAKKLARAERVESILRR